QDNAFVPTVCSKVCLTVEAPTPLALETVLNLRARICDLRFVAPPDLSGCFRSLSDSAPVPVEGSKCSLVQLSLPGAVLGRRETFDFFHRKIMSLSAVEIGRASCREKG